MTSKFKLNTWYTFINDDNRSKFLNNNPSYGRFVSLVELEPFMFVEDLGTTTHFKYREKVVDVVVFVSNNTNVGRDDRIIAVHNDMLKYIKEL